MRGSVKILDILLICYILIILYGSAWLQYCRIGVNFESTNFSLITKRSVRYVTWWKVALTPFCLMDYSIHISWMSPFPILGMPGVCFILIWIEIWASSWDYGTCHIGDQRRLRRACASAQSLQSLCCSHTWSMEVDEDTTKNQTSSRTGWQGMRVWKMSLRRKISVIIWSWHDSFILANNVDLGLHCLPRSQNWDSRHK